MRNCFILEGSGDVETFPINIRTTSTRQSNMKQGKFLQCWYNNILLLIYLIIYLLNHVHIKDINRF